MLIDILERLWFASFGAFLVSAPFLIVLALIKFVFC